MLNGKVYIAGHTGLAGSALVRRLSDCDLILRSHEELDLCDPKQVKTFFREVKPRYVFVAAGLVGGIQANAMSPAQFLRDNLLIATNVIHEACHYETEKLLYLASSCMYPRLCPQPMQEESLLSGPFESNTEGYALSKIVGLKLARAYRKQYGFNAITAIPTNLYGPNDNYHLESSHVIPALIAKICEAEEEVVIWGTGKPRREFLHSDDLADACVHLMENYDDMRPINVGCGYDLSIRELAELIGRIVGFKGRYRYDTSKPDGAPRKLLDVSKLKLLGWEAKIDLETGLRRTIADKRHTYCRVS